MAPLSSTLAWKILWMEEPGTLQSMGPLRVGHDWATSLSLFTFTNWETEMATHSSVLAWRIPGTGEPGGLLSMGSHGVRHDWSDSAAAAVVHHQNAGPRTIVSNVINWDTEKKIVLKKKKKKDCPQRSYANSSTWVHLHLSPQYSEGFSGKLLSVIPLNSQGENKIKSNGKPCQILIDTYCCSVLWLCQILSLNAPASHRLFPLQQEFSRLYALLWSLTAKLCAETLTCFPEMLLFSH